MNKSKTFGGDLRTVEVLHNPETQEIRVTFFKEVAKQKIYVVVKYFDPDQDEFFTFKVFVGSYEGVRKHWRTLTVLPKTEAVPWITRAKRDLRKYSLLFGIPI